ncbi:uncharacterized protein LOC110033877 isoform X2 [Phalaenopsis equestris]|uniref:uncharacterized protein LOC110033877 isoform X2 n=1 Tax=Phalaenopsis equestris TaxID=78828 RepID=UPI0009E3CA4D|nr:uncharacterized protein LOC110033877 isoform X2 [Phalaenopsis equestris]
MESALLTSLSPFFPRTANNDSCGEPWLWVQQQLHFWPEEQLLQSAIMRQISTKTCEECGGSGVCSECNGEGFILKKLSAESADRARMASTNMATRYTAGLPKKWSYCTKCSSSRSCRACDGTGSANF